VPVARVGKFIAIGLNFADHAAESNLPIPKEPVVFTKATSSLVGPNDRVMLPKDSAKSDWEVELGVVIGRRASYVEQTEALDHVAGFCVVNDVSEREYQIERGGTWDKGKGCGTFGPVGPWLVTKDEVPDPQAFAMWLDVNGKRMQTGNTRTMIFGVAEIVSYLSRFMTLLPGDIVTTGTPPGVGMAIKPQPIFLKPGNVMTLGIEGLGESIRETQAVPAPTRAGCGALEGHPHRGMPMESPAFSRDLRQPMPSQSPARHGVPGGVGGARRARVDLRRARLPASGYVISALDTSSVV
jgi:2,4-didehydro-3-deoxy-L-rhamnonate hydrolase